MKKGFRNLYLLSMSTEAEWGVRTVRRILHKERSFQTSLEGAKKAKTKRTRKAVHAFPFLDLRREAQKRLDATNRTRKRFIFLPWTNKFNILNLNPLLCIR